jgi:DNA-3-methyladenine glycosylase I
MIRCEWPGNDEQMIRYHDKEWGVPVHNDRKHYEFILLDGFQAGLSWQIILRKRKNFKAAFDNFDPHKIARYRQAKMDKLIQDAGIIRNRLKIESAVSNAKAFLKVKKEFGKFDKFIWQFVGNKTIHNSYKKNSDIPPSSKESDTMSKELKKRGFRFVGTTICYSYMQAAGMVNDHLISCYRYQEIVNASLQVI